MAEVRLEAELTHPPDRVWRALTDARLLSEWFLPTDLTPVAGSRFTLSPAGADSAGFSGPIAGEVVEAVPARRLVMLWRGPHLHTRVVWELAETAGGCRLLIVQSGFVGAPATLRQRALRAAYQQFVAERLPPLLDRLDGPSGGAGAGAGGAGDAAQPGVVPRPRQPVAETVSERDPQPGARSHTPTLAAAVARGGGGRLVAVPTTAAERGGAGSSPAGGGSYGPGPERPVPERPGPGGLVLYSPVAADPFVDDPVADDAGGDGSGADTPPADATARAGAEPAGDGGPRPRGAWRDWLAVVPAWGRALVLAVLGAVLAIVVLTGITQTWTPWPGSGADPGADDLRQGPGLATQPGDGASRTTPREAGEDADPAGGPVAPPGGDAAPEGGEESDRSPRPVVAGQAPPPDEGQPGTQPAPELTAEMTTSNRLLGLSGRAVSVTVSNPGPGEAAGWQVTMDVGDQDVTNVSGAGYERSGSVAIFTPLADGPVAGESLQFSFDIPGGLLGLGGATDPTDCEIDGRACG